MRDNRVTASGDVAAEASRPTRPWVVLTLLTAIYVFNQVDRRVVSLVIEPLKAEFRLSDGQIGLLSGLIFGAAYALCVVPLGLLADRVNRRRLFALVSLGWSLMTALGGLAQSFGQLLMARMCVGAAEAGAAPTAVSILSDTFPPHRRGTAIAIFQTATSIGAILCFVAGAWIVQTYGWRAAFVAAGLPGVPLALLLLVAMKEPRRGSFDAPAADGPPTFGWRYGLRESALFVFRDPAILLLVLAPAFAAAGTTGIMGWLPSFLIRIHGLDIRSAGLVVAMTSGLCGGIGLVLSGWLGDRASSGDPRRMLRIAGLVLLVAMAAAIGAILAPGLPGAIVAIGLYGLFCYAYTGMSYAALLNLTPGHIRSTVVAIEMVSANLLGYGGGPYVVGLLSDMFGGPDSLRWALLTLNLFYLAAALAFLGAARLLGERKP